MKSPTRFRILPLAGCLILGVIFLTVLFFQDNQYTAELPGGWGYSTLQDASHVAFLVDGWEYYPGELLNPDDFDEATAPDSCVYAGQYPNFSAHLGSPYGTAAYRLTLYGTEEEQALILYVPELLSAGKIYIDGRLVGTQGSLEPYVPEIEDGQYAFTLTGSTEIIIQCANYTHYYSGLYYPPAVGSARAIQRMLVTRLLVYALLGFSALTLALINVSQWILARDPLTRWMGRLSLAFALALVCQFCLLLGVPLSRPLYALSDLADGLVVLCAIVMAGEQSGAVTRWYHRHLAMPAAVGFSVAGAVFPMLILPYVPQIINGYGLALFLWKCAAGAYLMFLAFRACCTGNQLSSYLLCAAGLFGLTTVWAAATINRFAPICGAWPEEYGGFSLVLGFAAMLVRRDMLLMRENHRLTHHLSEEVHRRTQAMDTLLAERRELLAGLIHDVKNPLAAVRSYAELVQSGGVALDQETDAYLQALRERVDALGERLELLQDFSRGERQTDHQPLSLNELLTSFYQANRPDMELDGQQFLLALPQEVATVLGRRERLWSALENLCYNALSFTHEGGSITLSLEIEPTQAHIQVRDTGVGIAPEQLSQIFQRGFTSRAADGGDGLGLYLVRLIAMEHGGSVQAASQLGSGSTFTITLPLA